MTPPLPPRFSAHGFSDDEVDRFLAGASTPDELTRFRAYLQHAHTDAAWVAVLARYELVPRGDFHDDVQDGTADALLTKWLGGGALSAPPLQTATIAAADSAESNRSNASAISVRRFRRDASRRISRWTTAKAGWSVAAGLLVVIVTAIVIRSARTDHVSRVPLVYATVAGQRATVTLTDGSRVTLAPQSRLMVGDDFNGAARAVMLDGEAYFQVRPGTRAPFTVQTGRVTTRVLGTEFDVRHYASDSAVRVAVVSGKVAAGGGRTPVTLTAGTVGVVTDTTATSTVVGNITQYAEWTSGHLVFDNVRAQAMLATVGRWYGYEFRLTDSARAARRITADFNVASREETFRAIEALLNVTMQFDGTTVILRTRTDRRTGPEPLSRRDKAPLSHSNEVGK